MGKAEMLVAPVARGRRSPGEPKLDLSLPVAWMVRADLGEQGVWWERPQGLKTRAWVILDASFCTLV
jgi:hypothetical protein